MKDIKIEFEIDNLNLNIVSYKNERKSFEARSTECELLVSFWYDYSEKPLNLSSSVKIGDCVSIILREYIIELYVNNVLVDENWQYGKGYFELGDKIEGSEKVTVSYYNQAKEAEPSIISSFENAEGWRPENGVFVGDCMPYRKNDEYHVLYLKDRRHHGSKWGMGAHQWEHISTKDFKTWFVHPMAVPITESWECSICTGSHIEKDGREYLYYTIRRAKGLPAIIKRSVSEDGYHFTKDKNFGFTLSEKFNGPIARDPKVIRDDSGIYHMFLTTVLVKENLGCLAHYISKDLERWQEAESPIYVHENSDHPECPDYFKYKGKYYLIFSIRGRARYLVSDKPFDDFKMIDDTLIPCAGVPKCAIWKDKLVFTGFKPIDGYAGTMTFKSATADENGKLIFEDI